MSRSECADAAWRRPRRPRYPRYPLRRETAEINLEVRRQRPERLSRTRPRHPACGRHGHAAVLVAEGRPGARSVGHAILRRIPAGLRDAADAPRRAAVAALEVGDVEERVPAP